MTTQHKMKFIIRKSNKTLLKELGEQYELHQNIKTTIKTAEFSWGGLSCNLINPDECNELAKLEKSAKLALHKLWKSKMDTHFKSPQNKTLVFYIRKFTNKCSNEYSNVNTILTPLSNFYANY
jgi:hypothetical protein